MQIMERDDLYESFWQLQSVHNNCHDKVTSEIEHFIRFIKI